MNIRKGLGSHTIYFSNSRVKLSENYLLAIPKAFTAVSPCTNKLLSNFILSFVRLKNVIKDVVSRIKL